MLEPGRAAAMGFRGLGIRLMKDFLLEILAWWRGNTWGTRRWLAMNGIFVGEDEFGNKYYRSRKPEGPNGTERRMVVYGGGYADASSIPPGWHGWMHYRTNTPPTKTMYRAPGKTARAEPDRHGAGTGRTAACSARGPAR